MTYAGIKRRLGAYWVDTSMILSSLIHILLRAILHPGAPLVQPTKRDPPV